MKFTHYHKIAPVLSRIESTFHPVTTLALEIFLNGMRYINPRFTYLLTYTTEARTVSTSSNFNYAGSSTAADFIVIRL